MVGQYNRDLTKVRWARQFLSNVSDGFDTLASARSPVNATHHGHISRVRVDSNGNTYLAGRISCGFADRSISSFGNQVSGAIFLNTNMGAQQGWVAIDTLTDSVQAGSEFVYNSYLLGRFDATGELTGVNYYPERLFNNSAENPNTLPGSESILTDLVLTQSGAYATAVLRGRELRVNPSQPIAILESSSATIRHDDVERQRGTVFRIDITKRDQLPFVDVAALSNNVIDDGGFLPHTSRLTGVVEGGFAVEGAGEPGETGADTVGPVVTTESVPCVELLEKGVGWATVVAEAEASAEPVRTSVGTAKTEAKVVSATGKSARDRDSDRRW